MPDKLVTRGLVLRATETKEADYILTVLTAEHGRLAVIARGARRRSSKLAAACQLLAFSELVLYRRGSWHSLDDCAMCGRTDPVEPVFDAAQGVVLCKTCAGPAGGLPLDAGALAAMRHIVGAPSKRLLSFTLEPASLARLSVACETFAAVQLDRRFRTLDFYKSIRST